MTLARFSEGSHVVSFAPFEMQDVIGDSGEHFMCLVGRYVIRLGLLDHFADVWDLEGRHMLHTKIACPLDSNLDETILLNAIQIHSQEGKDFLCLVKKSGVVFSFFLLSNDTLQSISCHKHVAQLRSSKDNVSHFLKLSEMQYALFTDNGDGFILSVDISKEICCEKSIQSSSFLKDLSLHFLTSKLLRRSPYFLDIIKFRTSTAAFSVDGKLRIGVHTDDIHCMDLTDALPRLPSKAVLLSCDPEPCLILFVFSPVPHIVKIDIERMLVLCSFPLDLKSVIFSPQYHQNSVWFLQKSPDLGPVPIRVSLGTSECNVETVSIKLDKFPPYFVDDLASAEKRAIMFFNEPLFSEQSLKFALIRSKRLAVQAKDIFRLGRAALCQQLDLSGFFSEPLLRQQLFDLCYDEYSTSTLLLGLGVFTSAEGIASLCTFNSRQIGVIRESTRHARIHDRIVRNKQDQLFASELSNSDIAIIADEINEILKSESNAEDTLNQIQHRILASSLLLSPEFVNVCFHSDVREIIDDFVLQVLDNSVLCHVSNAIASLAFKKSSSIVKNLLSLFVIGISISGTLFCLDKTAELQLVLRYLRILNVVSILSYTFVSVSPSIQVESLRVLLSEDPHVVNRILSGDSLAVCSVLQLFALSESPSITEILCNLLGEFSSMSDHFLALMFFQENRFDEALSMLLSFSIRLEDQQADIMYQLFGMEIESYGTNSAVEYLLAALLYSLAFQPPTDFITDLVTQLISVTPPNQLPWAVFEGVLQNGIESGNNTALRVILDHPAMDSQFLHQYAVLLIQKLSGVQHIPKLSFLFPKRHMDMLQETALAFCRDHPVVMSKGIYMSLFNSCIDRFCFKDAALVMIDLLFHAQSESLTDTFRIPALTATSAAFHCISNAEDRLVMYRNVYGNREIVKVEHRDILEGLTAAHCVLNVLGGLESSTLLPIDELNRSLFEKGEFDWLVLLWKNSKRICKKTLELFVTFAVEKEGTIGSLWTHVIDVLEACDGSHTNYEYSLCVLKIVAEKKHHIDPEVIDVIMVQNEGNSNCVSNLTPVIRFMLSEGFAKKAADLTLFCLNNIRNVPQVWIPIDLYRSVIDALCKSSTNISMDESANLKNLHSLIAQRILNVMQQS